MFERRSINWYGLSMAVYSPFLRLLYHASDAWSERRAGRTEDTWPARRGEKKDGRRKERVKRIKKNPSEKERGKTSLLSSFSRDMRYVLLPFPEAGERGEGRTSFSADDTPARRQHRDRFFVRWKERKEGGGGLGHLLRKLRLIPSL